MGRGGEGEREGRGGGGEVGCDLTELGNKYIMYLL